MAAAATATAAVASAPTDRTKERASPAAAQASRSVWSFVFHPATSVAAPSRLRGGSADTARAEKPTNKRNRRNKNKEGKRRKRRTAGGRGRDDEEWGGDKNKRKTLDSTLQSVLFVRRMTAGGGGVFRVGIVHEKPKRETRSIVFITFVCLFVYFFWGSVVCGHVFASEISRK